jgi:hypothetical protein
MREIVPTCYLLFDTKIVDLFRVVSTLEIIHIEKATGIAVTGRRKFYAVLRATGKLLKQLQRE